MLDDADVIRLRRFVAPYMSAVAVGDRVAIERIYADVSALLRCDPKHALAVVLADQLRQSRDSHAKAIADGTEYARAYLDQKERVAELRDILDARAGASPGKRAA